MHDAVMVETTIKGAQALLAERAPFRAETLSAHWTPDGDGGAIYWVKSYGVIIAQWGEIVGEDGVAYGSGVVWPNAYNYSVTTSKHANIVKRAWNV